MTKDVLRQKLIERIKEGHWKNLFITFFESDKGQRFLTLLKDDINRDKQIFPKIDLIFRAFNLCPYNDVNVVLLATRPFRSVTANGLCFGISKYSPIYAQFPRSTNVISYCLEYTIKERDLFILDQGLQYWADQGVLMLNSALTSSLRGGHMNAWGWFIINVLLDVDDSNIPFVGIGEYPSKMINKFISKGHIITCKDTKEINKMGNWDVDIFNDVNKFLTSIDKKNISWH